MGQSSSLSEAPVHPTGTVLAHMDVLKKVANLTYKDFCDSVTELNAITSAFTDHNGKQLHFRVQKGSDATVLWKATVRVRCMKVNTVTNRLESSRLVSLRQFVVLYREIADQVHNLSSLKTPLGSLPEDITTSKIFDVTSSDLGRADDNECCICMDRRAAIILTCNHEFCEMCIDSWGVAHNTCPLCRSKVESVDDTWVLAEKPMSIDYETEVKGYLVGLADREHDPRH